MGAGVIDEDFLDKVKCLLFNLEKRSASKRGLQVRIERLEVKATAGKDNFFPTPLHSSGMRKERMTR